ncbi:hypothetical protein ABT272_44685 [Streptomyces sp900105245]|uniref:Uncharacterized protein n=1 Tax=Streptomyces sp. 900105245 TaxID=3154379 RepID=A0ABV1ULJ1_9ACTN
MNEIQRVTKPQPPPSPKRPLRDRRRRQVWRIGVPVAVLAAAGGTAAAVVIGKTAPAASPALVQCVPTLSANATGSFVVPVEAGHSPEQACRTNWTTFVDNENARNRETGNTSQQYDRSPAELVSCTASTARMGITVYPRPAGMTAEQACTSIGLVRPAKGPVYAGATAKQIRQLQALIAEKAGINRSRPDDLCRPYATTRTVVEQTLRELGLNGWHIDDQRTDRTDGARVWYDIREATGTVVLRDDVCTIPADQPTGNDR